MAKIGLTKLITVKKPETKICKINDMDIEIKQYLPLKEKLGLIQDVGIAAIGEKWVNPVTIDVLLNIKILQYYTNINITENQLSDAEGLFDLLELNHIVDKVLMNIPETEIETLRFWLRSTVQEVSSYNNSALGIVENLNKNYDATKLDLASLNAELQTPEMQEFVKNLPNLG